MCGKMQRSIQQFAISITFGNKNKHCLYRECIPCQCNGYQRSLLNMQRTTAQLPHDLLHVEKYTYMDTEQQAGKGPMEDRFILLISPAISCKQCKSGKTIRIFSSLKNTCIQYFFMKFPTHMNKGNLLLGNHCEVRKTI